MFLILSSVSCLLYSPFLLPVYCLLYSLFFFYFGFNVYLFTI